MKTRDIITGLVVLIVLVVGVLLIRNVRNKKTAVLPTPTPSISQRLTKTYPSLNIPAGTVTADLKDVSGGQAMGVATKTEIVANLPDLAKGQVYQGYLENSQGKMVLLGTFHLTKSGWLLSYDATKYSGYNKIIVMVGTRHILEGSF